MGDLSGAEGEGDGWFLRSMRMLIVIVPVFGKYTDGWEDCRTAWVESWVMAVVFPLFVGVDVLVFS